MANDPRPGEVRVVTVDARRLFTDLADLPDRATPAARVRAFVAAWLARHPEYPR